MENKEQNLRIEINNSKVLELFNFTQLNSQLIQNDIVTKQNKNLKQFYSRTRSTARGMRILRPMAWSETQTKGDSLKAYTKEALRFPNSLAIDKSVGLQREAHFALSIQIAAAIQLG